MKKNKIEFLILLIISIGLAILLPNFYAKRHTIVIPNLIDLSIWTIVIFIGLAVFYFSYAGSSNKEKALHIPNGYHELLNESDQITKKGFFEGGKLYNGSMYVYKKDGTLSHIEICKNGIYTKAPIDK